MSIDYTLFVRDEPDFAELVDDHPGLKQEEDGHWTFPGFNLSINEYRPEPDDVLADQPWQREIRWWVSASGRHPSGSFDDWEDLVAALNERYRGAEYCDATDHLRWYWWDRDELGARIGAWVAAGDLAALTTWLRRARGADGERPILGAIFHEAPAEQVADLVIAALPTMVPSAVSQELLDELGLVVRPNADRRQRLEAALEALERPPRRSRS